MNEGTTVLNQPADMPQYEAEPVRIIASKPTPGPYHQKPQHKGELFLVNEGCFDEFQAYGVDIMAGTTKVGEVEAFHRTNPNAPTCGSKDAPFEEVAANGNLFAASWDLLQAAEKALAVFGKCPFFPEEFEAALALKDAIAKAYGQGGE